MLLAKCALAGDADFHGDLLSRCDVTGVPGAAQCEAVSRRPGIVTNSEPGTVPDQRRSTYVLHRVRDTSL